MARKNPLGISWFWWLVGGGAAYYLFVHKKKAGVGYSPAVGSGTVAAPTRYAWQLRNGMRACVDQQTGEHVGDMQCPKLYVER